MANSEKFKSWAKIETARILGTTADSAVVEEKRVKTYNFKENRVTNHLTGKESFKLKEIMDGNIEAE